MSSNCEYCSECDFLDRDNTDSTMIFGETLYKCTEYNVYVKESNKTCPPSIFTELDNMF